MLWISFLDFGFGLWRVSMVLGRFLLMVFVLFVECMIKYGIMLVSLLELGLDWLILIL